MFYVKFLLSEQQLLCLLCCCRSWQVLASCTPWRCPSCRIWGRGFDVSYRQEGAAPALSGFGTACAVGRLEESPRLWEQRKVCEASASKHSGDENVVLCEERLLRPLTHNPLCCPCVLGVFALVLGLGEDWFLWGLNRVLDAT